MAPSSHKARTASLHDDVYAHFVQLLVDKRVKSGLSQQAVADALGWNQSIIAKIETAQRRLDVIELIRIANVVGFDAARLVRDVQQIMAKADGR
jgi:transcriptional regulator with XRE-family HTH domain